MVKFLTFSVLLLIGTQLTVQDDHSLQRFHPLIRIRIPGYFYNKYNFASSKRNLGVLSDSSGEPEEVSGGDSVRQTPLPGAENQRGSKEKYHRFYMRVNRSPATRILPNLVRNRLNFM